MEKFLIDEINQYETIITVNNNLRQLMLDAMVSDLDGKENAYHIQYRCIYDNLTSLLGTEHFVITEFDSTMVDFISPLYDGCIEVKVKFNFESCNQIKLYKIQKNNKYERFLKPLIEHTLKKYGED